MPVKPRRFAAPNQVGTNPAQAEQTANIVEAVLRGHNRLLSAVAAAGVGAAEVPIRQTVRGSVLPSLGLVDRVRTGDGIPAYRWP